MFFLKLILQSILRQRGRSFLTVLGISVGVMTIVVLITVGRGFQKAQHGFLKSAEAELTVFQADASDIFFSTLAVEDGEKLYEVNGVKEVAGVLIGLLPGEKTPYLFLTGFEAESFPLKKVKIVEGRLFGERGEVILGKVASRQLGKVIGERVKIGREELVVVGIGEAGNQFQDAGAILPLATLQGLLKKPGQVSLFMVVLEKDKEAKEVGAVIEAQFDDFVAISEGGEIVKIDQSEKYGTALILTLSLIAILGGGIGVANTMVMRVFAAAREIGILRAVGWSGGRILRFILLESLFLGLLGAVLGSFLGILLLNWLGTLPEISPFLSVEFILEPFLWGFSVALGVGLVGGLYPALWAVRLPPLEALRYE